MEIKITSPDWSDDARVKITKTFDCLSDAAEFVERVRQVEHGMPAPVVETREVEVQRPYPDILGNYRTRAIREAFRMSGRKSVGIAVVRNLTGCSLKEAKDFLEYTTFPPETDADGITL